MTEQEELRMLRERLGPRGLEVVGIDGIGHYVNEKVKAEIERLRGGENWRRYASYEILRQAVIELRRSGDISGVTTEKMKKLFPEIKSGWEDIPAESPEGTEIAQLRGALKQLVEECVNPGDGGPYEAGEWPALDAARCILTSSPVPGGPEREYEPGVNPADDAEFGMKP